MSKEKGAALLISWVKQIGLIILFTLLISTLFIQTYKINDVSMEPTFDREGNRVLVFLTPYIFNAEPDYGDILIVDNRVERERSFGDRLIENPLVSIILGDYNEHLWVKRVIGLPGDHIEYEEGKVYRNGRKLVEEYTAGNMVSAFEPVVVPEDHIFFMGDNRNRSSDSREIGPVPTENIQGRVILRFFPLHKISTY